MEIKFKTILSQFKKGEKACYRAVPISNGVISEEQMLNEAAAQVGMDPALIRFAWDLFKQGFEAATKKGYTVNIADFVKSQFSVKGVFDSANAPWDKSKHVLKANVNATGSLATALADATGQNITEGNRCRINGVQDTIKEEPGVITQGEDITVTATGATFLVDTMAPDEGAWLENMDGTVAELATVTASTATTLTCVFEQTPEPGEYNFVVAPRGGLGPEYGVSMGRRKVNVVAAE